LVIGIGGGHADYFGVNEASYLTVGPTYYLPMGFVVSYDYRRSFPKGVKGNSDSHVFSLRIKGKGKSSTRFWVSTGRYVYLSENVFNALNVSRKTNGWSMQREQWLTDNFGVNLGFDYASYFSDYLRDGKAFNRYKWSLRLFHTW
jgi:YaiO family outer membrane protein